MFDLVVAFWFLMIAVFVVALFVTFAQIAGASNRRADAIARRADAIGQMYQRERAENIRRYGRDSRGNRE